MPSEKYNDKVHQGFFYSEYQLNNRNSTFPYKPAKQLYYYYNKLFCFQQINFMPILNRVKFAPHYRQALPKLAYKMPHNRALQPLFCEQQNLYPQN